MSRFQRMEMTNEIQMPEAKGQINVKCQSPNDKQMTRFKTQMIHPVVIARSPSAEGRRSNLAEELQSVEIAAHLSGARNDKKERARNDKEMRCSQ